MTAVATFALALAVAFLATLLALMAGHAFVDLVRSRGRD